MSTREQIRGTKRKEPIKIEENGEGNVTEMDIQPVPEAKKSKTRETGSSTDISPDLKLEDVRYMLRALEEDAYSAVVSALRAQGPLSEYKRALLDHLKAALFVSAERHKAEIRRATNDDILMVISKKMNPMCDPFRDWYLEGCNLGRINPTPGMADKSFVASAGQDSAKKIAERLMKKASEHNQNLNEGEEALLHLLQLPKKPQVPESLKFLINHGPATKKPPVAPKLISKATSPIKTPGSRASAKFVRKTGGPRAKASLNVPPEMETTSNSAHSTPEPTSRSDTPSSAAISEPAFPGHPGSHPPRQRSSFSSTAAEVVSAVAAGMGVGKLSPLGSPVSYPNSPCKNGPHQVSPEAPKSTPTARAKAVKKVSSANPNLKTLSPKRAGTAAAATAGPAGSPRGVKSAGGGWHANLGAKKPTFSGPKPDSMIGKPGTTPKTTPIGPPRGEPVMRCARVEPFVFPPAPPGSNQKPPRGNPDKRVKKHPNIVPGLMRSAGRSVGSLGTIGSPSSLKRRKPPLFYDEIPVPEGQDPSSTNVDDYIYSCLPHRRTRGPVAEYYGSYYTGTSSAAGGTPTTARTTTATATVARGAATAPRYTTNSGQFHSPYYPSGGGAARLSATGVAPAAVQAAYSSPTRPYYGNPSAAALGITVRPTGDGGKPVVTAQQTAAANAASSGSGTTAAPTEKVFLMRQSSNSSGGGAATPVPVATQSAAAGGDVVQPASSGAPSSDPAPTTQFVIAPKGGGAAITTATQQLILPANGAGAVGGNGNVVIVRRVPGDRPVTSATITATAPQAPTAPKLVRPTVPAAAVQVPVAPTAPQYNDPPAPVAPPPSPQPAPSAPPPQEPAQS